MHTLHSYTATLTKIQLCAKISMAKRSQFQPTEVFAKILSLYNFPWPEVLIYLVSLKKGAYIHKQNFCSTRENHENHESLAQ